MYKYTPYTANENKDKHINITVIFGHSKYNSSHDMIAPIEKNIVSLINQNDLFLFGNSSARLFVVIGIMAPNDKPIMLRDRNRMYIVCMLDMNDDIPVISRHVVKMKRR
jgi:hypothetical protein